VFVYMCPFDALVLLVGSQEGLLSCKKSFLISYQKFTFGDWPNLQSNCTAGRLNKNGK